jgi:hypothetical protein
MRTDIDPTKGMSSNSLRGLTFDWLRLLELGTLDEASQRLAARIIGDRIRIMENTLTAAHSSDRVLKALETICTICKDREQAERIISKHHADLLARVRETDAYKGLPE